MSPQFSSPRPNLVESDSGFSVEVLGRVGMRYTEHGRTAFVDSEVLATPGAMLMYSSSIERWEPPHEGEALEAIDKSRIIENIKLAFQSQNWDLQQIP